ncbi:MAG: endopeptidase La [Blastocatellia bacterium]|nr:endopeptidase La [Blastocatellia bacterium]MCS7157951.1 endopeptidase La [Blastocatellia bacterium]MCX7752458.1 endopeptidase La [Blastocatellia bacterium]MDW8167427.1 endopeptidase La [Acidobacteriota bacterium]MDW8257395.1 endopeptidase La [Acidobacteriota bacterium]
MKEGTNAVLKEETIASGRKVLELPVLPLRNTVVFPFMPVPLVVGRRRSVAAVESAVATEERWLVAVAQRRQVEDEPAPEDLYTVGTLVVVKKMLRTSEDTIQILVQGMERVRVLEYRQGERYLSAQVEVMELPEEESLEIEALHRNILDLLQRGLNLLPNVPQEIATAITTSTDDPVRLAFTLAALLNLEVEKEQALLEAPTRRELLRLIHRYLAREIDILELRRKVAGEAQAEMDRAQREYFLRQQLKAIQRELGEEEPEMAEVNLLRERLEATDLPDEVRAEAERELRRMERLPATAPDYHVIRTYLEWILELPWRKSTEDNLDLEHARQILEEDHYDLEEVKDRILEFLAVLKLKPGAKSPILCFVGPPGVGKTSLGQSIARALGRRFERMSLGGVRDEAELRGHRRTYVGALPGRIIQALRRAGTNNPVLMLDEVDKLGVDFRGDPAAALLEVLDPQQNHTFRDHYLDLPFDLSRVFFICTANTLATVPPALRDRMEVIPLPGYSEEQKFEIARRFLLPRQIHENGLQPEQLTLTDEALRHIISRYTREAGVRQLERSIGQIARKVARKVAEGKAAAVCVDVAEVKEYLGPEKFFTEQARKTLPPGVAPGLAWTETGGEVIYVEATLLPGGKGLTLTGQLGEIMQESARAAQSYLWAHARQLGIALSLFEKNGVHLHVPAGAVPKDGPSAGVTMVAALASLYLNRPVRADVAMTGEITLSGLVLPIGGVKEKVLAARRAGIRTVILPKPNLQEVDALPPEVRADLTILPVETIDEVLQHVFVDSPTGNRNGHKRRLSMSARSKRAHKAVRR